MVAASLFEGFELGFDLDGKALLHLRRQLGQTGGSAAGQVDVSVNVSDYPLEIPMHRAYMSSDTIDFSGSVSMFNHAGLYLE